MAPILVKPSIFLLANPLYTFLGEDLKHTSHNHGTSDCPCRATEGGKIDIHRVDNALEVKWYLNIQHLTYRKTLHMEHRENNIANLPSNQERECHSDSKLRAPVILEFPCQKACNMPPKRVSKFTFGQRYFAISFIIAQSAFLCSLATTDVPLRRSGLFVDFALSDRLGWMASKLLRLAISVTETAGRTGVCFFWLGFSTFSFPRGLLPVVNIRIRPPLRRYASRGGMLCGVDILNDAS